MLNQIPRGTPYETANFQNIFIANSLLQIVQAYYLFKDNMSLFENLDKSKTFSV